ncbi:MULTISPECIES: glutamate-5-semialdehyde dehydrogenase [Campylobacter]|uniref:Gamma-glutamyl phosphate reductase n=1 Tax=Campylobacter curvus (strain 525.92) TaxID=360105 RepID=PROA_CAMC5|nr:MULTISPECIES: glutamate-5-semialdehyde dehydrogenase [Campylobacter]A7GVZ7.1 RecName: Full=Gamma-glutamyl phosphate reductase; Short=GPR; AltName: Full=Glutamate-5-semialdehyde dehydrogenase; AltName: Full=Glutamyl-gamma-semialdehyde dehydrogenase; Short=GSA dehydrogenase [Campylobacter curvus 525.92]EAT99669.1 glutamate-5-semialdehyde dehydrogenase [Campylobacter curvus 525.92]EJP75863.1 glutamate-5-semialdehyde dehydrogenase [Campylobacter sp. FOBRC14]
MSEILNIAKAAKASCEQLLNLSAQAKSQILNAVADELVRQKEAIKAANLLDLKAGENAGLSAALLDRLELTDARIEAMANGVREVAKFDEVVGEVLGGWRHPNGMQITKIRVPLGVLGIIYESRPNVSIDAAALALKSGNAVILRGSAAAISSNKFLVNLFNETGAKFGLPKGAVALVESTDKEAVGEMIKMHEFIDVLIPRGGKNLKDFIIQNATIPVIETGAGVCHIFVDESADVREAVEIIKNAKTQRPSTCNSVECVLLHERVAVKVLTSLARELDGVQLRVHEDLWAKFGENLGEISGDLDANLSGLKAEVKIGESSNGAQLVKADESDFGTEFLSLVLAVKCVSGVAEAVSYINSHSTHHSDAILSRDYANIERFLNAVDSAVVYANASTRFSDGGEFGFGGEIGISTQKLHARGPMGVRELTTSKYVVRGDGQIR